MLRKSASIGHSHAFIIEIPMRKSETQARSLGLLLIRDF